MGHLSIEEIHRVAALAKLRLTDSEAAALHGDLESILGHIDTLQSVDLDGVEPMASPLEHTNRVRPDEPASPLEQATLLNLAPATEGKFVLVPSVLEGDGL